MRYSAHVGSRSGGSPVTIEDSQTGAEVVVFPHLGATTGSIRLSDGVDAHDILVQDPVRVETRPPYSAPRPADETLFAGRVLFPFADRIPDGRYVFAGREYTIEINDTGATGATDAIHGFAHRLSCTDVTPTGDDSRGCATMRIPIDESVSQGYPFRVDLSIAFELSAAGFTMTMVAQNTGDADAPLSAGWHPYFRLPMSDGIDRAYLVTNADRYIPVDDRLLPTGPATTTEGTELDFRDADEAARILGTTPLDVALTSTNRAPITTHLLDDHHIITIRQRGAFVYQQLFTPPSRRGIAIEPLTGTTNAFNMPQYGLRVLRPGEQFEATCSVTLDRR